MVSQGLQRIGAAAPGGLASQKPTLTLATFRASPASIAQAPGRTRDFTMLRRIERNRVRSWARACPELIQNHSQIARFGLSEKCPADSFRYGALAAAVAVAVAIKQQVTSSSVA